jgi:hypothetical protein
MVELAGLAGRYAHDRLDQGAAVVVGPTEDEGAA